MEIDVEARAQKRLKAEAARRAEKWPRECPKCFSPIGDRCRTLKGVVTMEHIGRSLLYSEDRNTKRYPAACPICKRGEGLHCVSLYNGKKIHVHRDRPQR